MPLPVSNKYAECIVSGRTRAREKGGAPLFYRTQADQSTKYCYNIGLLEGQTAAAAERKMKPAEG